MKRRKNILIYFYFLLLLTTFLTQSQQNCINRLTNKNVFDDNNNQQLNSFELLTKLRSQWNSEKQRIRRSCNADNFLGSNLFDGIRKKCFTAEDISLLTARMQFERMLPTQMAPNLMTDHQVKWILHYFCYGHFLIDQMPPRNGSHIVKKAFYDTLGGFLHYYLLPIAKASFYAGRVKMRTVLMAIAHYHKCRRLLNTNGNGWRAPMAEPLKSLQKGNIRPLNMRCNDFEIPGETKYCEQLDLEGAASSDGDIIDDSMLVPLPKIEFEDADGLLGNMLLPYLRKRTFNLRSPNSAYILVEYFKTVNACYDEKHMNAKVFNSKLRDWMLENIQMHLNDNVFYPGLGSVLNLYESLRRALEKPQNKRRKKSKNIDGGGERIKKDCQTDIDEAMHKHRCKSLKYINLESKSKQINYGDCERNWLDDPLVSGKSKCDKGKKKSKWFSWGKSNKNKAEDDDKERGNAKEKDKDLKKAKDKEAKSKKKKKWNWGFDSLYKKGSWGLGFPKLKGLSLLSKCWEIMKFIIILLAAIILLYIIVKVLLLCLTLSAGPITFVKLLGKTLFEFGKLFLTVLTALIACTAALPCWRCCGGGSGDSGGSGNKKRPDNAPIEKVVIVNEKQTKGKPKKERPRETKGTVEPKQPQTAPVDSKKKEKEDGKSKKAKSVEPRPPTTSKSKDKSKQDKKPKSIEPPPSAEKDPKKKKDKKSEETKKEKPDKKSKEKPEKQTRKSKGDEITPPPPPTTDEEAKKEKPDKKSKDRKEKPENKSKSVEKPEPAQPPPELKEDKSKKDKKSKEKDKTKEKDKKSKKTEDAQEVSFRDTGGKSHKSKPRKKGGDTKRGQSRRKKGSSDSEYDDSSTRLRGGQSNPDWYTDWEPDSSSLDDCDGKTSWKTFYDF